MDVRTRYVPLFVLLGIALALALSPQPALNFLHERLFTLLLILAPGAAIVGACIGAGTLVVLPCVQKSGGISMLTRSEFLLFSLGCGTGLFSCVILILGMSGMAYPAVVFGIVLTLMIIGIAMQAWFQPLKLKVDIERSGIVTTLFGVLVAASGFLLLTSSIAPPLLYDVTEYHLGALSEYLRNPGNAFQKMPHNFYARFPFPIESLYFAGLAWEELRYSTDFSPKVINAAFVIAGALLVGCWLRRAGVARQWRVLGQLLYLAHPVVLEVSLDAYIDAPCAFLVGAGLFASALTMEWIEGPKLKDEAAEVDNKAVSAITLLPVALLLWGTAFVSKYTIAQLYALPFLLIILLPVSLHCIRTKQLSRLLFAMVFGATPLIMWLGKNILYYGNPLEPFFTGWFRADDAAAIAREKFYVTAHYPQAIWTPEYWQSFSLRFQKIPLIYLAPLIALFFHRVRLEVRLLIFCLLAYGSWNLIRESQNRFLLGAIMIVIIVGAAALSRLPVRCARHVAVGLLALYAAANLFAHTIRLGGSTEFSYLGEVRAVPFQKKDDPLLDPRGRFIRKNLGALGEIAEKVNALGAAKVLLVYEARPYLFTRPTVYNTVFDDSVLLKMSEGAKTKDDIVKKLKAAGVTHVLVNREELRRFIEQYIRPEQLQQLRHDDPATAFLKTRTPEDYYPPFYTSPQWSELRPAVLVFLNWISLNAPTRTGKAPLEVQLMPLP